MIFPLHNYNVLKILVYIFASKCQRIWGYLNLLRILIHLMFLYINSETSQKILQIFPHRKIGDLSALFRNGEKKKQMKIKIAYILLQHCHSSNLLFMAVKSKYYFQEKCSGNAHIFTKNKLVKIISTGGQILFLLATTLH